MSHSIGNLPFRFKENVDTTKEGFWKKRAETMRLISAWVDDEDEKVLLKKYEEKMFEMDRAQSASCDNNSWDDSWND